MSEKKKGQGLKSALDLALERMGQRAGGGAALNAEQKQALAEVERGVQAKVAETEIMMAQALAVARAKGDAEEIAKIEEQKRDEIARIRRRGEDDKDRIRAGN
jgi:hypothetical protein